MYLLGWRWEVGVHPYPVGGISIKMRIKEGKPKAHNRARVNSTCVGLSSEISVTRGGRGSSIIAINY